MRTATIALTFAALAAPIAAQAPTKNLRADSAFARGEWTTALAGYLDLVKRDSAPQVWFRIGIAQHGLGNYSAAVQALTKARQLGAVPMNVELRIARAYAKLGDRANALAHLDSVANLASSSVLPPAV